MMYSWPRGAVAQDHTKQWRFRKIHSSQFVQENTGLVTPGVNLQSGFSKFNWADKEQFNHDWRFLRHPPIRCVKFWKMRCFYHKLPLVDPYYIQTGVYTTSFAFLHEHFYCHLWQYISTLSLLTEMSRCSVFLVFACFCILRQKANVIPWYFQNVCYLCAWFAWGPWNKLFNCWPRYKQNCRR